MTANARRPVFTKQATLTRSQTTATKLFDLPANCHVTQILVISSAASTGATITLGTSGTAAYYVNGQSIASAGVNRPATTGNEYTATTGRQGVYGSIGGSPSSGGPFKVVFMCTSKLRGAG